jgi:hypothetical protein
MILCTWCASDEYVDYDEATKVAVCTGPAHSVERMWEPAAESKAAHRHAALGDGKAAELGLYEDLPLCLSLGEWAETGVVEHRYGAAHPTEYAWMVKEWGHVAQGRRQYSVTTFIGSTLASLSRAGLVANKAGIGTGFFGYNSGVGMWTLVPVPSTTTDMTWATLATKLGHQPGDWPLLGYESSR